MMRIMGVIAALVATGLIAIGLGLKTRFQTNDATLFNEKQVEVAEMHYGGLKTHEEILSTHEKRLNDFDSAYDTQSQTNAELDERIRANKKALKTQQKTIDTKAPAEIEPISAGGKKQRVVYLEEGDTVLSTKGLGDPGTRKGLLHLLELSDQDIRKKVHDPKFVEGMNDAERKKWQATLNVPDATTLSGLKDEATKAIQAAKEATGAATTAADATKDFTKEVKRLEVVASSKARRFWVHYGYTTDTRYWIEDRSNDAKDCWVSSFYYYRSNGRLVAEVKLPKNGNFYNGWDGTTEKTVSKCFDGTRWTLFYEGYDIDGKVVNYALPTSFPIYEPGNFSVPPPKP